MMELIERLEDLVIPLTFGTGVVISLADLFDFLRFMGDHTPMLAVLLISVALGSLAVIQHRCRKLHEDIRELVAEAKLEHLDRISEQVDPNLRKVLDDDYFDDILAFFQMAIHEKKVELNDDARFHHYVARTLQLYPKATFFITCTSATTHLWMDSILDAMGNFVQRGGTIRLLFFFKDPDELLLPEVKMTVSRLQRRGVQVLATYHHTTLPEHKKNFIVESRDRIAWEFEINGEGYVTKSMLTTDKKSVQAFNKTVKKLRHVQVQMATEQEAGANC